MKANIKNQKVFFASILVSFLFLFAGIISLAGMPCAVYVHEDENLRNGYSIEDIREHLEMRQKGMFVGLLHSA